MTEFLKALAWAGCTIDREWIRDDENRLVGAFDDVDLQARLVEFFVGIGWKPTHYADA